MDGGETLLTRVMAEAEHDGWWREGVTVAAAVSGGPDSMALLHILWRMAAERPFRIVAAHVNHGFRGAESDAEAGLVRRAAAGWGILLEETAVDVPAYIEETRMNAQAAARDKRYEFLLGVAEKYGAAFLMLGHHADDQAETVMMRVLRGTGVAGLAGIPFRRKEKNVELIRPLLRIPKQELQSYCERNGVPYAVDSSNANTGYFRNAVRLELMPVLEQYNPRLRESLCRLADMAAADDDYLDGEAESAMSRLAVRSGGGFRLERCRFRSLHVALQRRLIKLILMYCSNPWHTLEYRLIEEIRHALGDGSPSVARIDIGNGWTFLREYDRFYIGPARVKDTAYRYPVMEFPASLTPGSTGTEIRFERVEGAVTSPPDRRWEAFFDESGLTLPLIVRTRLPGDRMEPAGLNGTKKVQDMFVDAKVPRSMRDEWPLLADSAGRLLWIPGLRRARHAEVGKDTRSTIRVTASGLEDRT